MYHKMHIENKMRQKYTKLEQSFYWSAEEGNLLYLITIFNESVFGIMRQLFCTSKTTVPLFKINEFSNRTFNFY